MKCFGEGSTVKGLLWMGRLAQSRVGPEEKEDKNLSSQVPYEFISSISKVFKSPLEGKQAVKRRWDQNSTVPTDPGFLTSASEQSLWWISKERNTMAWQQTRILALQAVPWCQEQVPYVYTTVI